MTSSRETMPKLRQSTGKDDGSLESIRSVLANVSPGALVRIQRLPAKFPAWIIRDDETTISAAVIVDDMLEFYEQFTGIRVHTSRRWLDGRSVNCLHLTCENYGDREPFAPVCADFLHPRDRQLLISNPKEWCARWSNMLGNAFRTVAPYAVLGELIVLGRLWKERIAAQWDGPEGGSHDIACKEFDIEIKSTVKRYDSIVTIAGQHQLTADPCKTLHLAFLRLEERPGGDWTIESAVKRLVASGFSEAQLERCLNRVRLQKGKTARTLEYALLESRVYDIDDAFPRIVPTSFVAGVIPNGIVRIAYDVDVATLPAVDFDVFVATKIKRRR